MLLICTSSCPFTCGNPLSILDNLGVKTLGVLDVDGLDVGVELLLGAILVVTLTRDADTEAERNALDAGLPDLLVQLGVEADVGGALGDVSKDSCTSFTRH